MKTYNRYSIHFCSKKVTSDLLKIGLHSSKSFSCNFLNIDDRFIWHFIRGLFDGDGCISIINGRKGRLSFSLILSGELKCKIKDIFINSGLSDTKDSVLFECQKGIISSIKYTSYKDVKKNIRSNVQRFRESKIGKKI